MNPSAARTAPDSPAPTPLDDGIVVTGMGVWCAAGTTPAELFHSVLSATSAADWHTVDGRRLQACRAPLPEHPAEFPQARRMDPSARFAIEAARSAFTAARLMDVDPQRIGLLVGNSRGPVSELLKTASPRARATQAANTAFASLSGAVSLALGVSGPCMTLSATCASAAHAIAVGAGMLQGGQVDAVLAGGAEAPIVPRLMEQFAAAGILGSHPDPQRVCRPFDLHRNGTVLGEGAAFLVLERRSTAVARGIPVLAHLAGYAMGAECHSRAAARLDGAGLACVMRQALAMNRIDPLQIGCINAHGTGTVINDAAEAAAIRQVFGDREKRIKVSSTKGVTGHCLGACAAIEALITILALRHQVAPATCGHDEPDPALGIDVIRGAAHPLSTRFAMKNSLGLWGNTASLIFGLPEQAGAAPPAQPAAIRSNRRLDK